ncbi:MAG: hypothetical protein M1169_06475 [Firmicutes bacterium]|nr:hypothetical protein [Bacillota bacterium]
MLLHFARDCQGGWRLVQFHGLFLKEEIEFSNILIKNLLENARTREPLTIVDLGKTIKTGVNNFLKKNLSGIEYIAWAVEEGNTTKRGTIPGGLGLSLIREFLKIF